MTMNENIESDVKAVQGLTMLKFSRGCVSEEESHTHTHTHTHTCCFMCAGHWTSGSSPPQSHPATRASAHTPSQADTHPLRPTHTPLSLEGREVFDAFYLFQ